MSCGAARRATSRPRTGRFTALHSPERLTAVTDSRFRGCTTTPGLVYGPIAENIHGYDERVDIDSIRRCTQAMAFSSRTGAVLDGLGRADSRQAGTSRTLLARPHA